MSREFDSRVHEIVRESSPVETATTFEDVVGGPAFFDASDVLLLGPLRRSIDDEACTTALGHHAFAESNLLLVSLTQSASDRFQVFREHFDDLPEEIRAVSDADEYASETVVDGDDGPRMTIDVVSDPSDIPRLGMTISKTADRWTADRPLVGCFHSLTALLQYTGTERVFRFVHLLQNRLDGTIHYHMDADAHADQTIATLQPLFDVIVEYDVEGNVTVVE